MVFYTNLCIAWEFQLNDTWSMNETHQHDVATQHCWHTINLATLSMNVECGHGKNMVPVMEYSLGKVKFDVLKNVKYYM